MSTILCSNLNSDGGIIMDDNFAKWLELATDLVEKTIKNYTRAIKKISFDLSEKNIVQMSLEEITTEEDLKNMKKPTNSKITTISNLLT